MTAPSGTGITRLIRTAGKRVLKVLLPSAIVAEMANRRMKLPTVQTVDAAISAQMQAAAGAFDNLTDQQRELVMSAVDREREQVTGLEAKGFAAVGLPLGVLTLAVLILPHPLWPTIVAAAAIFYAASAVFSAALVVKPSVRAAFNVERATASDALPRLVAVSLVNRDIGTAIQNRVWASLTDTFRSAVLVLIAALILILPGRQQQTGGQPANPTTTASQPPSAAAPTHTPTSTQPPPPTSEHPDGP